MCSLAWHIRLKLYHSEGENKSIHEKDLPKGPITSVTGLQTDNVIHTANKNASEDPRFVGILQAKPVKQECSSIQHVPHPSREEPINIHLSEKTMALNAMDCQDSKAKLDHAPLTRSEFETDSELEPDDKGGLQDSLCPRGPVNLDDTRQSGSTYPSLHGKDDDFVC